MSEFYVLEERDLAMLKSIALVLSALALSTSMGSVYYVRPDDSTTVSTSMGSVNYVRPDDSTTVSCPGQPCLTLDQYIQQTATYFTAGSTFAFLDGNHSLSTAA
jgi:hypothetical protein